MANLSVRKLDDNTYQQLRSQAQMHGVSVEEEVRQIIYQAVIPAKKISHIFKTHFGKKNGVNLKTLTNKNPINLSTCPHDYFRH